MAGRFRIDYRDPSLPVIRRVREGEDQEGRTLADCKQELYEECDFHLNHWREMKARVRAMRVLDIEDEE